MAFTNPAEWTSNFSFDKILSGDVDFLLPLIYLIVSIAIYSILIYHFYRYIARRDCFKPSKRKYSKIIGFIKYFLLFPFVAVIFFMGFSLMLIFLTKTYPIDQLLATSFAIIIAIRITSYYTEDLSKDVAKMLPFALLGIFLVDPTYFTFELVKERINSLPANINFILQFIFLIIIVEWILRISLNIVAFVSQKRKKTKVEEPKKAE